MAVCGARMLPSLFHVWDENDTMMIERKRIVSSLTIMILLLYQYSCISINDAT